jgi:hypothetical protein
MSATTKLLDKWKKANSIASDNAAAIRLKIGRAAVSRWRNELGQAEVHLIAQMAQECGEDSAVWMALVESERARSAEDRKVWAALARRLGAAAAVFLMLSSVALPSTAKASQGYEELHIMRSYR